MTAAFALTEKEWQAQVVQLARTLGWLVYHPYDSRRSAHGYPDLTLVRDRVVFAELKTETGRLTVEQRDWLTSLRRAGAQGVVARPHQLQALADFLGCRDHRLARTAAYVLDCATSEELAA